MAHDMHPHAVSAHWCCGRRQVAFAELLGCAASCGYLALLMREVDGVTPSTRVPLAAAERVAQQPARALALAFAAYRCAALCAGMRNLILQACA